jgi:hypothetical protein
MKKMSIMKCLNIFFDSVWVKIQAMFNRETGREANIEQLRKLFGRLRSQTKKVLKTSMLNIV